MIDEGFARQFSKFLIANGRPGARSVADVVEEWDSLVEDLEDGYQWIEAEYTNDLSVRDSLERACSDEALCPYRAQMDAIRSRLRAADERLRKIFDPGVLIGLVER